jgi:hypothetical protein
VTVYIDGANRGQYDAYRTHRTGPARNVTHIADATTLATVSGTGHVVVYLCGYHSRADASVIESQIKSLVDAGSATERRDPVGG